MDRSKFWDRLANRYSKQPISDPATYEKKLDLTQRYLTEESNVLEIGCGTGSTALVHAPKVKHLLAIDFSKNMIDIAKRKFSESQVSNLDFRVATLFDLPDDDESFDAVLALNVLHLMDDVEAVIQKVHQLLEPNGLFVSSTPFLAELPAVLRFVLPIGGAIGIVPKLRYFNGDELNSWITNSGFTIIERLEPAKKLGATFLIARKTPEQGTRAGPCASSMS